MGASLLAIAVDQLISMSTDPPLSRASSLPQVSLPEHRHRLSPSRNCACRLPVDFKESIKNRKSTRHSCRRPPCISTT
ncbi:hypothetical protein FHK92_13325 [Pseudomonas brassicacearum subsp. neoaurantiaca]|uniref:Uncharacterized protein n=1 Tax=Pseudomonas brassicacearum subsp. neoaurantiaca TaxID=494916 RepID=A0A7V8UD93_9PSED|nr:hypothetical protein [Pseudomonas brassicacearum subsp. neoaurantiaca]